MKGCLVCCQNITNHFRHPQIQSKLVTYKLIKLLGVETRRCIRYAVMGWVKSAKPYLRVSRACIIKHEVGWKSILLQ